MTSDDDPHPIDEALGGQTDETPKKKHLFQKGNPGKPKGQRCKATVLAEQMMRADAEPIVQAVIDAAKGGDPTAQKLCIDRIYPRRREPTVELDLPKIETISDLPSATQVVINAVAEGQISPSEGSVICSGVIAAHQRALEVATLEQRIAAIEEKLATGDKGDDTA